jgi:nucleoside-diphosphate-sugar epimerase
MVTEVYRKLLGSPAAVGQIVNICSGTPYSLKEILRQVEELTGHGMQVEVNQNLVRDNEVQVLWGDRSKLEALLDDIEVIPLRTTLQWMLEA